MALALPPPFELNRSFQPPLPSPTVLLASAAMEQANKARPSLPSISSLIEAVAEHSERSTWPRCVPSSITANTDLALGHSSSPTFDAVRRISGGSHGHGISPDRPKISGSPRSLPPPTPEFPPTSSFDFARPSPTNTSPGISHSRSNYHQSTNPELYAQRPSTYPPATESVNAYSSNHSSPWSSHPPRRIPDVLHHDPPVVLAAVPSSEPPPDSVSYSGMAQQRPLPTDFPGPLPGISLPPIDAAMAPTWQHHHYYPPANPPSYPQTQERYICPTSTSRFPGRVP